MLLACVGVHEHWITRVKAIRVGVGFYKKINSLLSQIKYLFWLHRLRKKSFILLVPDVDELADRVARLCRLLGRVDRHAVGHLLSGKCWFLFHPPMSGPPTLVYQCAILFYRSIVHVQCSYIINGNQLINPLIKQNP